MEALCMHIHFILDLDLDLITDNSSSGYMGNIITANSTLINITTPAPHDLNFSETKDPSLWEIKRWTKFIFIPVLCVFGIIGNILNLIVFFQRCFQNVMETLEKCSTVGLISLALCDLGFCTVTVLVSWLPEHRIVHKSKDFVFYFEIYGPYLQNVLIKVSTWFTVVMAVSRFAAICHPIHTRRYIQVKHVSMALTLTLIAWIFLQIPLLWTYSVVEVNCGSHQFLLLDMGHFLLNHKLNMAFTYTWTIIGFFIPVIILIYANSCLINALRRSSQIRRRGHVEKISAGGNHRRLTIILVLIITNFFIFVCPSEILHFLGAISGVWNKRSFALALMSTNLLQAVNFSFNFILYCMLSSYFRRSILNLLKCQCLCRSRDRDSNSRGDKHTLVLATASHPFLARQLHNNLNSI